MVEQNPYKIECESCHRSFAPDKFYKRKDGVPMKSCKGCVAAMIDINNSTTFKPFLEECDYPYIPNEWQKMVNKYEYTNDKRTGLLIKNPKASQIVFSNYVKRFRLPKYQDLGYKDTEKFIQQEIQLKREREEAVEKDMQNIKENLDEINMSEEDAKDLLLNGTVQQINGTTLTRNELNKLKTKWGQVFSELDLVRLETLYQEMHSSFEINTASHEDYLKKIVKTSIMMDSALETGNTDEYSKLSKVYDNLMKSANFTAAQEKKSDDYIDSIGEMARLCEEKGFIPRYHIKESKDVVDITLKDLNNYTHDLVINELNLDSMVETALEAIQREEEEENNEMNEEIDLDDEAYMNQILSDLDKLEEA